MVFFMVPSDGRRYSYVRESYPSEILDFNVILDSDWPRYDRTDVDYYGNQLPSIVVDYQSLLGLVSIVE